MSYIARESAKRMKSYSIFPKSMFGESPNFVPFQFRNRRPFGKLKNIFGTHYPKMLAKTATKPRF
jgi:hypothetical protein